MPVEEGELTADASIATFTNYLWTIIYMPNSLRVLCLTNLFCWMSLVCYSLYFTDFVGEAVFKGRYIYILQNWQPMKKCFSALKRLSDTNNTVDSRTTAVSHVGHNSSAKVARSGNSRTDAFIRILGHGLIWKIHCFEVILKYFFFEF